MRKYIFLSLVLFGLILSACSPGATAAAEEAAVLVPHEDISAEMLVDMMTTRRETFVLINTLDFQLANLPGTDLMISFDRIGANLDQLPEDKNAEIVLYCRSGNKSSMAAAELVQAGYTNVKNLVGGMVRWHQLGLPLLLPE